MGFNAAYPNLLKAVEKDMPADFEFSRDALIAGRWVALAARFDVISERKLFGIMPTGNKTHCHELCLFMPTPALDEPHFTDLTEYFKMVQKIEIQLDRAHEFTMFSFVLLTDTRPSAALQKKIRTFTDERKYQFGWSSARIVVADLQTHKMYHNKFGAPVAERLRTSLKHLND